MLKYDIDRERHQVIYDNKLLCTDAKQWEAMEFNYSQQRVYALQQTPSLVKQTFDGKHLQALHKHIFQDCYDWAGELRDNGGQTNPHSWHKTKTIDGSEYTSLYTPDAYISGRLSEIGNIIKSSNFGKKMNSHEVLSLISTLSDRINEIHCFREGNSRTKRLFIKQVADKCGYNLDFSKTTIKNLTETEFVVNSIYKNGNIHALTDNQRVSSLSDLYAPLLESKALAAMRLAASKNPANVQKNVAEKTNGKDYVME